MVLRDEKSVYTHFLGQKLEISFTRPINKSSTEMPTGKHSNINLRVKEAKKKKLRSVYETALKLGNKRMSFKKKRLSIKHKALELANKHKRYEKELFYTYVKMIYDQAEEELKRRLEELLEKTRGVQIPKEVRLKDLSKVIMQVLAKQQKKKPTFFNNSTKKWINWNNSSAHKRLLTHGSRMSGFVKKRVSMKQLIPIKSINYSWNNVFKKLIDLLINIGMVHNCARISEEFTIQSADIQDNEKAMEIELKIERKVKNFIVVRLANPNFAMLKFKMSKRWPYRLKEKIIRLGHAVYKLYISTKIIANANSSMNTESTWNAKIQTALAKIYKKNGPFKNDSIMKLNQRRLASAGRYFIELDRQAKSEALYPKPTFSSLNFSQLHTDSTISSFKFMNEYYNYSYDGSQFMQNSLPAVDFLLDLPPPRTVYCGILRPSYHLMDQDEQSPQ